MKKMILGTTLGILALSHAAFAGEAPASWIKYRDTLTKLTANYERQLKTVAELQQLHEDMGNTEVAEKIGHYRAMLNKAYGKAKEAHRLTNEAIELAKKGRRNDGDKKMKSGSKAFNESVKLRAEAEKYYGGIKQQ